MNVAQCGAADGEQTVFRPLLDEASMSGVPRGDHVGGSP